MTVVDFGGK